MEYIVLAVLATVFLLGIKRTADVASLLQNVEQRRNLAIRLLGFLTVSIWLKVLPALLLTIYMREHRFLAPEVFDIDFGRATIVGIYVTPFILLTTAMFIGQPLAAFFRKTSPTLKSWDNAPALLWAGMLIVAAVNVDDPERIYLTIVASVVLSIYISITLHASIETQLKLHFFPILAVVVVTAAMFVLPKGIESLVSRELRSMSSGGGVTAIIKTGDTTFRGKLLLASREAAYLELNPSYNSGVGAQQCLLRVPVTNSILQFNADEFATLGGSAPISDCSKRPQSSATPAAAAPVQMPAASMSQERQP